MGVLIAEVTNAVVLAGIFLYLLRAGKTRSDLARGGWGLILAGFGLLWFASVLDITDNFDGLSRYVVLGKTPIQAVLEELVGYLGGFLLVAIGLRRWIPTVSEMQSEITAREAGNAELRVANRMLRVQAVELEDARRNAVNMMDDMRRAEDALKQSERQRRAILDNIPDIAWLKDGDGRYTAMNQAFIEVCGRTVEELVGKTDLDIWPTDLAEAYRANDEEVMVSGERKCFEEPFTSRDGESGHDEAIRTPIFDGEGKVIGTAGIARDITRRKEAEDKRARLPSLQRALIENVPACMFLKDRSGRYTAVNPAYLEILPDYVQDPVGKRNRDLFPARVADVFDAEDKRVLEAGETVMKEDRLCLRDGRSVDMAVHLSPLRSEDGKITGMVGVAFDITERKKAEDAVRKSEAKFRLITDNVSDVIWTMDTGSHFTYLTPSVKRILGYDAEELLARKLEDILAPGSIETAEQFFEQQLNVDNLATVGSPVPRMVELEHIRKDGSSVWCEVTAAFLLDEQNWPVGIQGITRDLTEWHRAQKEIALAMESWQDTFDAMLDRVMVLGRDYRIVNANKAMRAAYSGEDIVGAACHELLNGGRAPHPEYIASEVFRTGTAVVREMRSPVEEGRWEQVYCYPIKDETGTVAQVVHVTRDITEKKQAAEALQRDAAELAALNSELERSNRDMEEFGYAVSHDLQEPLRKIHTFGEFLVEDCEGILPETGKDYVHRMQNAVLRMKDLIHHLLNLSRVGTRGGEMVEMQPRDVIDAAVDTLSVRAKELGAEIRVDGTMPLVKADRIQLERVFQNLIGNALKFHVKKRPPRITVTGCTENSHVLFSIRDNGIGVEEKYLEKIFGVFQRLHARKQYEGSGVGLALCAKIVHRHGGKIWAESTVGEGATFNFTLPTANGKVEPSP